MPPRTPGPEDQAPISYYNVAEIDTACMNLATRYSGLATPIVLPELTHEGRTCRALRLGSASGQQNKPAFMVIGGQHACEWGSCEIALHLAADLLRAYTAQEDLVYGANVTYTAAAVTNLLDTVDVVLFPLVNPDGREFSQMHDGFWRKNRSLVSAGTNPDSIGVDLNRNYDFLFKFETAFIASGTGISVSASAASNCYRGLFPFSEPETRNVKWLLEQFPATRWFVDLHSGAQDVIHPWGDDETQHGDSEMNFDNPDFDGQRGNPGDAYGEYQHRQDHLRLRALARRFADTALLVNGAAYGVTSGYKFNPSCGTSHDWVYSRHLRNPNIEKTLAFAIEWCGDEYIPTWSRMLTIIQDVSAGLIGMALAAQTNP